jgi:PAS domain S-box-containing protein
LLPKIVLLGREEKRFNFVLGALNDHGYQFEFVNFEDLDKYTSQLIDAKLIILDTIPVPENFFSYFHELRQNAQLSHVPILALVKESPPRLRYRIVNLGITEYLTVPFDRLDLQMRVQNILRNTNGMVSENNREPDSKQHAVYALQSLKSLYQEMDKSIFSLGKDKFLDEVLESLRKLSKAHYAMLFDVAEDDHILLTNVRPAGLLEAGCKLSILNTPILLKVARLGEPTFLNMIAADNPFVMLMSSFFNIRVRSCIVFPIQIQKNTRSILCLLKSDEEKLSEFHYLLVQNFAHFIIHSYQLKELRNELKGNLDNQIWQFYFDFLEQVVNQLSFGLVVITKDRRINFMNEHAAQLLSVSPEEALYRHLNEILDERVISGIMNSTRNLTSATDRPEFELEDKSGKKTLIGYSVQGFTDKINQEEGYIISLKDITYTKEIQEEMRRVDRLASLGVMASGIAHEIRNPLAGIKAMVQTFEDELAEDDPKREYMRRIVRLVNRLDKLIRTLFSYAKPSKPNRQSCNVESILVDVISLFRQKFKEKNIRLAEHVHPDLPDVFVDPSQIQQVLVNLILNSVEAIEKDGQIIISIQPVKPGEAAEVSNRAPYLTLGKSREYIEIKIQDNGCGISAENLQHIFNPFFTTKSFGTGLGLSIVYQINKENDGLINYESEDGKGATCFLYLPAKM